MQDRDQPPNFVRPGDNPELDAALAALRSDGQGGDPLFPEHRKRRPEARAPHAGATPGAASPAAPTRRRARWILFAVLLMLAPIITLAMGILLESLRQRRSELPGVGIAAPPSAAATAAPPAPSPAPAPAAPASGSAPELASSATATATATATGAAAPTAARPARSGAGARPTPAAPAPASSDDFFLRKRGP